MTTVSRDGGNVRKAGTRFEGLHQQACHTILHAKLVWMLNETVVVCGLMDCWSEGCSGDADGPTIHSVWQPKSRRDNGQGIITAAFVDDFLLKPVFALRS